MKFNEMVAIAKEAIKTEADFYHVGDLTPWIQGRFNVGEREALSVGYEATRQLINEGVFQKANW